MFGVNATGDNAPKSSSSLKYNSSTGGLTAGSFIGDGSGLTGITASGSGVIVEMMDLWLEPQEQLILVLMFLFLQSLLVS